MTTAIIEYSETEAALANLASRYKGVVYDVRNSKGMKDAKAARSEIKGYRVALEHERTRIKKPALERCQLIDTEARRITRALEELENPIDAQIKAEENRVELERQAAIRAEQERIEAEARAKREEEERKLAEERAKVEAEAKRLAEERAAFEAEQRRIRDVQEAEERARLARERAALEEQLNREREERMKREESARMQQELERMAREARERAERKEREKKEAEERERLRKLAEIQDATEMLNTFVRRFGRLPQFSAVVQAIRDTLGEDK